MRRYLVSATLVLGLSACAARQEVAVETPPAPPPAPIEVAMPKGGYPGMKIPAKLPEGGYATPNRNLSAAAGIWHWRVALNVAALACRGPQGDAIVAKYNALLAREKAPLAAAEKSYAAEFKASGAVDWRDRYDDGMTRLYNFFSQSPARDDFCAAAAETLADAGAIDDAALPGFAAGRLAVLEKPFTDFYAAFDAWRTSQIQLQTPSQPIYALAATASPGPAVTTVAATASAVAAPSIVHPRLTLDPSVFQDSGTAH